MITLREMAPYTTIFTSNAQNTRVGRNQISRIKVDHIMQLEGKALITEYDAYTYNIIEELTEIG